MKLETTIRLDQQEIEALGKTIAGPIGAAIDRLTAALIAVAQGLGQPVQPAMAAPVQPTVTPKPQPVAQAVAPKIAAPAPPKREPVWTDARKALLREEWPKGASPAHLYEALNKLPGPLIASKNSVSTMACGLGLVRPPIAPGPTAAVAPPWAEAKPSQLAPTPTPATPAPRPALPPVPRPPQPASVEVTYETAMAWAGQRGLASVRGGMDVAEVNRKREQLGLPPFVIVRASALSRAPEQPSTAGA